MFRTRRGGGGVQRYWPTLAAVLAVGLVAGCGGIVGDDVSTPTPEIENEPEGDEADDGDGEADDIDPEADGNDDEAEDGTDEETEPTEQSLYRVNPDEDVTVESNTLVFFEAGVENGTLNTYGDDVEWTVSVRNESTGEWESTEGEGWDYSGHDAEWLAVRDSTDHAVIGPLRFDDGTYRVEVEHDDESVYWTVHARESGPEPVTVDPVSPTHTTVYYDETVEWEVQLNGETGPYTLYWWVGACDELVAPTETVDDGETASTEIETNLIGFYGCPMIPFAIGQHGMPSETHPILDYNLTWETASQVEMLETNSPVDRGDTLQVDTEIANEGTELHTVEVDLVVEDVGTVNSTTVDLEPGETAVETFTYETDDEDREEFDVQVSASTGNGNYADATTVRVDQSDEGTDGDANDSDEETETDQND